MFISIKLKKVKVTPTKINKFLNQIKNISYKNLLIKLSYFPKKINFILKNIIYSNKSIQKNDIILINSFANRDSIFKKVQARAKGQAFYVQRKLSNINFNFCTLKVYKIFNFIKNII